MPQDPEDNRSQFAKDYNISEGAEKIFKFQFGYALVGIAIAIVFLIIVNIAT